MDTLRIRRETDADIPAIHLLVARAFAGVEHSAGTEPFIVDALRRAGALTLSLLAVNPEVVGHVAASPVTIGDGTKGWFGIGPVAVDPPRQGRGVGSALMERVLEELRDGDAAGAVLLGEPEFYSRFGFRAIEGLTYPEAPPDHFLTLPFRDDPAPQGVVTYHPAFHVTTGQRPPSFPGMDILGFTT